MSNIRAGFGSLIIAGRAALLCGALMSMSAFGGCVGNSTSSTCTSTVTPIGLTVTSGSFPQLATVYPSANAVSGMTGTITSIKVVLNGLTHTDPDDLDMVLVAPDGRSFVFWSDIGSVRGTANACPTSPYACSISNFTITVSDDGATLLPDGNGASGQDARVLVNNTTYKPTNNGPANADSFPSSGVTVSAANSAANWPTVAGQAGTATFASIFNGSSNVNGTWNLYIALDSCCGPTGSDPGSLTSWSLIITTSVTTVSTTTSLTRSPNNSTFVGAPVTFTATVDGAGAFSGRRSAPVTLGTVTFKEGPTVLAGPTTLSGTGTAAFTTSSLTEGVHVITAEYNGATGFGASSSTISHTVDRQTVITGNKFCNPGTITLFNTINSPGVPYPSNLFVSGLSGTTQKITMDLKGFTHPVPDDVDLLLVSPTGQKFVPFASVAGVVAVSNIDLTLDDAAVSLMPSTGSFVGGTYRPSAFAAPTFPTPAPAGPYQFAASQGAATFINTFSGAAPNGTWQLFAASHGASTAGTRQFGGGWCLTFTTSSDPATTTTPSVAPTPSAVSQSVTVAALVANATNSAPVNALGTVNFTEGSTPLAGPLNVGSNGVASFTKSDFTQGAHFVTANYNGAPGSFGVSNGTVLHYVDGPTSGTSPQFCNISPVAFPNTINASGAPYPTRILVSGLAGTVQKVTATLKKVVHQFPDDIDMMLSGPNGNSLVLFSDAGGSTAVASPGVDITLDDAAASALSDAGALTAGTFKPFDYQAGSDIFAAPAPTTNVFSASNTTLTTAFANINPNGYWSLFTTNDSAGSAGGGSLDGGWCLTFTMNRPDLTITKTHSGNFTVGQTNAQYSVTVTNNGPGATQGTVEVTDTPTSGLTITAMTGSGWTCTVATGKCTTTASVGAGQSYPVITVAVTVATNASSPQVNSVTVAGGGDNTTGNNTANDSTIINQVADLTITKSSSGSFVQGGTGLWNLTVNNIASAASSGAVTISDNLPAGFTINGLPSGSGWNCASSTSTFVSCDRTTAIAPNSSAPTVAVNVNIPSNAAPSVTNTATVAGGGELVTSNNSDSNTVPVVQLTSVTVNVPAGIGFTLNSIAYTGSQTVGLSPGTYTLSTTTPQTLGAGTRAVFVQWSDAAGISRPLTVGASALMVTGTFTTQYLLTTAATAGGSITPATGSYFDSGSVVNVTATADSGFSFTGFTGDLTGTVSPQGLTMNAPKSVTANFASSVAPNVTAQMTVVLGAATLNRGTGRFVQPVTVTNTGAAIGAAAFVMDNLAAGVASFAPSGITALAVPAGSPYKEIGAIAAGGTVSFTLEFTRTGTPAVTYTPRVLGAGAR